MIKKEIGWLNRQKESVIRRGDGHSPMEVGDLWSVVNHSTVAMAGL